MTIQEKFDRTIKRYGLIHKGDRILIAFSGGADSTALLSLFLEIKREWDLDLGLGHFNHRLRKQADRDEALVRETGSSLGLPVYTGSVDVKAYSAEYGLNLEEAGRLLRYDFLKKTALRIGASKIATAHTQTDQAETFLIRLMRGSGRKGLSGIFPAVDGKIIRPLLEIKRSEVEKYLGEKKLSFQVDKSNWDKRFLRNRIRLDLIPFIKKRYDPQITAHLANAALVLQEEEALLSQMSEEAAAKAVRAEHGGAILDAVQLSRLPLAIARRVIRIFIEDVKGDLRAVSFHDVETVRELEEGKKAHLKKDFILIREKNLIRKLQEGEGKTEYFHDWSGKKPLTIGELGVTVFSELIAKEEWSGEFHDQKRVALDRDKLQFPLTVRSRQDGDRYRPCGAPGSKKIKEIFRARNISPSVRDQHPVFLSGGEIVWVFGLPVSEKHKITNRTRTIFLLTFD